MSTVESFKVNDKVRTERGADGKVIDIISIEGKPYIKVRWHNRTLGVFGKEEIKRYKIKKVLT